MDLICPECRGPLVLSQDEKSARCSAHGGDYTLLFFRPSPTVPPANSTSSMDAPPIISTGNIMCPQQPDSAATVEADRSGCVQANARCIQHPHIQAVARCKLCGLHMCPTCDFSLPGNVHLCPACASAPQTALSPKRKRSLILSLALALWSSVGMACLLAGIFARAARTRQDQQALGLVLILFVLAPATIGLTLGLTTKDRRLPNSPAIWIAIIWNGLIVGAFLLLSLIGIAKQST